jgi:signal transduction histidine kinase
MTSHLVHDLNNLLTVMSASLDLIAIGATPTQVQAEQALLRRALDSATELAKEMVTATGTGLIQRESVDVNLLVAETVPMLRRALRRNTAFEVKLGATSGTIFAKPLDLERILLNLTLNASKAMTDGGVLTVTTESLPAPSGAATPGSAIAGSGLRITVKDTGRGLPVNVRRLLKNPLTIKKTEGIGLASVSLLVMRMNGQLRWECPPRGGTTFHIDLPVMDRAD